GGSSLMGGGGVPGQGTAGGKTAGGLAQQGQLGQGLGGLGGGGGGSLASSIGADAYGRPLHMQLHLGPGTHGGMAHSHSGGAQRQLGHIAGPPTNEALLRQLELLRQM
ncbi:hypothetical protein Vafri_9989, partial [Volvox africanus]